MVSPQELGEWTIWSDRVHANDIFLNHQTKSVRLVLLITVYVTQHCHARQKYSQSWLWGYALVTLALGRWKQEYYKFKVTWGNSSKTLSQNKSSRKKQQEDSAVLFELCITNSPKHPSTPFMSNLRVLYCRLELCTEVGICALQIIFSLCGSPLPAFVGLIYLDIMCRT